MVDVVVVRTCIAFGGGLGTTVTAAVGGALAPVVMVDQIASKGIVSEGEMVKSGESHRTIEEGSSNRMMRLSKLYIST